MSSSDKQRLRLTTSNRSSDVRLGGQLRPAPGGDQKSPRPLGISRSKSSQAMTTQDMTFYSKQGVLSASPVPAAVLPAYNNNNNSAPSPKMVPISRPKNPGRARSGYMIHRSEGLSDLSNIQEIPGFYGSIANILEEFQRQVAAGKSEKTGTSQHTRTDRVKGSLTSSRIGELYYSTFSTSR